MNAYARRGLLVSVLLGLSFVLRSAGLRLRSFSNALAKRLERERAVRTALQHLHAMSDSELKDIGIGRSEIERVAREPSQPARFW
jgi:uncharacterized protein YjiS (DUF1127 family)